MSKLRLPAFIGCSAVCGCLSSASQGNGNAQLAKEGASQEHAARVVIAERIEVHDKEGRPRWVVDGDRGLQILSENGRCIGTINQAVTQDNELVIISLGPGYGGGPFQEGALNPIRELLISVGARNPIIALQTEAKRWELSMSGLREIVLKKDR